MKRKSLLFAIIAILFFVRMEAQESAGDYARAAQNPLANIISVPFQNNTNFGFGPNNDRTQNILNIQPVLPFFDGKLITRTIIPLLWQPNLTQETGSPMGLSDIVFTAFYSPKTKGFIVGFGPVLVLPTGSPSFGTEKWSAGPSMVMLKMHNKWVFGFLVNNFWSFAGNNDRNEVNSFLLQYFINYNLSGGRFFSTAPIITANWLAPEGQKWEVPVGLAFGQLIMLGGKLPLNLSVGYYYNVVAREIGPKSQLRVSCSVMLPRSILRFGNQ